MKSIIAFQTKTYWKQKSQKNYSWTSKEYIRYKNDTEKNIDCIEKKLNLMLNFCFCNESDADSVIYQTLTVQDRLVYTKIEIFELAVYPGRPKM